MPIKLHDNALFFAAAMKYKMDEWGSGALKWLASETGYSEGYLSQIKSKKRVGSEKAKIKIAGAFKCEYFDLINYGKSIYQHKYIDVPSASMTLTPQQPLVIRESQPVDTIMDKASRVLMSNTIYGDALRQNIEAFYHAVNQNWQEKPNGGTNPDTSKKAAEDAG